MSPEDVRKGVCGVVNDSVLMSDMVFFFLRWARPLFRWSHLLRVLVLVGDIRRLNVVVTLSQGLGR